MQDTKMTIFYFSRTGKIKDLCSGTQDMSFYGENAADFDGIIQPLVTDFDRLVFDNPASFCVQDGSLRISSGSNLSKYIEAANTAETEADNG